MYILVISLCISAGTLTETALDEHGHISVSEQLESYMRMFQHGVLRETGQYIIMRGIEIVTRDTTIAEFSKMSTNNKTSVFNQQVQIIVLAEQMKNCCHTFTA